jgi:hypothetical protein
VSLSPNNRISAETNGSHAVDGNIEGIRDGSLDPWHSFSALFLHVAWSYTWQTQGSRSDGKDDVKIVASTSRPSPLPSLIGMQQQSKPTAPHRASGGLRSQWYI